MTRAWFFVFLLLGPACFTDPDQVPDLRLQCEENVDCPDNWACDPNQGRCVPPGAATLNLSSINLPRTIYSAVPPHNLIDFEVTFSGPLTRAYARVERQGDFEDAFDTECENNDVRIHCALLVPPPDELGLASGVYGLTVIGFSGAGEATSTATLTLDFDAPRVVAGTMGLDYDPPPQSPFPFASALTDDGALFVSFALDETSATTPIVTLQDGEQRLTLSALDGSVGAFYRYALQDYDPDAMGSIDASGSYPLSISATDAVGNESTEALDATFPAVVIDREPPAPLDVDVEGAAVYHREPWGTSQSEGAVRMRLELGVEAFGEEAGSVLVTSAKTGGALLGVAELGFDFDVGDDGLVDLHAEEGQEDGRYALSLLPSDFSEVFVATVDGAGNVSEARRVRDVLWTASLGGKIVGDNGSNPHRFTGHPPGVTRPDDADDGTAFGGEALALPDQDSATTTALAAWRRVLSGRDDKAVPGALEQANLVFDESEGRFVLISGSDADDALFTFFREEASPLVTGSPLQRVGELTAVYRRHAEEVLLFGAPGTEPARTLRLQDDDLELLAGPQPDDRLEFGMAAHADTDEVFVFGGRDLTPNVLGDTWVFSGGPASGWTPLAAGGPGPRWGASLVFDPAARAILMFGGAPTDGTDGSDETWRLEENGWVELSPATRPPARRLATAATDHIRGVVYLFGGRSPTNDVLSDVWRWDGLTWTEVTPSTGPTLARSEAAAAVDPSTGELWVFGGRAANGAAVTEDLWRLRPEGWSPVTVFGANGFLGRTTVPGLDGGAISFGGHATTPCPTGPVDPDVLRWDGQRFGRLPFGFDDPLTAPSAAAATPFPPLSGILVVGGQRTGSDCASPEVSNDTYLITDTAVQLLAPLQAPPPDLAYSLAYDPMLGQAVLVTAAGFPLQTSTWAFDGSDWTPLVTTDAPVPRARPSLAFDPIDQRLLLFGGVAYDADEQECGSAPCDVWAFENNDWAEVDGATPPAGLFTPGALPPAVAVSVPAGGPVRAFGLGPDGMEMAEWTGSTFVMPQGSIPDFAGVITPTPALPAFVIDGEGGLLVSQFQNAAAIDLGGVTGAQLASFDVQAANWPADTTLVEATIKVHTGAAAPNGAPGVALSWWDRGQFSPLAQHDLAVVAPLEASLLAGELARVPVERLVFRLSTVGTGGGTVLSTDYVELRVTARLPPG